MSLLTVTAALLVMGPAPAVSSIRIERGGGMSVAAYRATLYADGSIRYFGQGSLPHVGEYKLKTRWESFRQLGRMVVKLGFFQLKDRYVFEGIMDASSLDITITRGKQVKKVHCYIEEPDEIWLLATAIDKIIDDAFEAEDEPKIDIQVRPVQKSKGR